MPLPQSRLLGDVLDALARAYPGVLGGSTELQWRHGSSYVMVAVNGHIVSEDEVARRQVALAEGDEVTLLAPLGGGAGGLL